MGRQAQAFTAYYTDYTPVFSVRTRHSHHNIVITKNKTIIVIMQGWLLSFNSSLVRPTKYAHSSEYQKNCNSKSGYVVILFFNEIFPNSISNFDNLFLTILFRYIYTFVETISTIGLFC